MSLSLLQLASVGGLHHRYGSSSCPCVGIDYSGANRSFSPVRVADDISSTVADFPAELGTSCRAWDDKSNPICRSGSSSPAFCKQRWCFVDPCNCDLPGKDKQSSSTYLSTWTYHKKPLHFSYETCNSKSEPWFEFETAPVPPPHVTAKCSQPEKGIGSPTCPCVGLAGRPGHLSLASRRDEEPLYQGMYKAELGATCGLWEQGAHPDCTESPAFRPHFCMQTYCFVDPCNCKGIAEAPRPAQMIAGSTVRGRPVYMSHATCGGNDVSSDGFPHKSCWHRPTKAACEAHSNALGQQCGWLDGTGCIDGSLVPICSAPEPVLPHALEEKTEL